MDAFLVAMENDMTRQLRGTDNWSSSAVNFRKWIYTIEELVGVAFNLPDFSAAKRDKTEYEMVTVSFKNNKVASIFTTLTIASPSNYNFYAYNNQTLDIIHKAVLSKYGKT